MVWDKQSIVGELRRLHKAGHNLSYNHLAKKQQAVVSAAAYHFGSYRRAVEKAGITYAEVLRRPRWSKALIVKLIQKADREGEDLFWSSVISRRDELGKAAFASLQKRLFGRWSAALAAAGIDAGKVARYRSWTAERIIAELRGRAKKNLALNSGAVQHDCPGLHAAAVRHFGSHDDALKAAKLNPAKARLRQRWTKARVIEDLKSAARKGNSLSDTGLRRSSPALYGGAVRIFGSFTAARKAAGIKFKKKD